MSNPAFTRKAQRFPVPDGATMTYDDVIVKTLLTMAVLLAAAVVGWSFPALSAVGAIVAFVIGMVNIFKRNPSAPLTLAYAVFEGFAVGGLSSVFETLYPGVVLQAVIGTFGVMAACLLAFTVGGFRATPAFTKMVIVAMFGYLAYSILNVILVSTGVIHAPFGLNSAMIPGTSIPVGVVVGVFVVLLAAFNFIIDFTEIEEDVKSGAPANHAWRSAFGLMLTIVWLYLELLRLLAILSSSDD